MQFNANLIFQIWSIRNSFCSDSIGILLLPVFASIARSQICIPHDSINEPHLQHGTTTHALFIRVKVLEVALWLWKCIVQLLVLRIISWGTLVFPYVWEWKCNSNRSTLEWISFCWTKIQSNENLLFNIRARGVHSARLEKISPTPFACSDWTVSNLHSGWFYK